MITLWFSIVVLAWVLFFVLEGFDFGVGVLGPLLGRDDHERGDPGPAGTRVPQQPRVERGAAHDGTLSLATRRRKTKYEYAW